MQKHTLNTTPPEYSDKIQAKTHHIFVANIARLIRAKGKSQENHLQNIEKDLELAALCCMATGQNCTVEIRPTIEEGVYTGFYCELKGPGLEAMAQMDEQQIATAIIPHIIKEASFNPDEAIQSFFGKIMAAAKDAQAEGVTTSFDEEKFESDEPEAKTEAATA